MLSIAQKTQCYGNVPCARCSRLQFECKNERPRMKRGRPKKATVQSRSPLPRSNSPSYDRADNDATESFQDLGQLASQQDLGNLTSNRDGTPSSHGTAVTDNLHRQMLAPFHDAAAFEAFSTDEVEPDPTSPALEPLIAGTINSAAGFLSLLGMIKDDSGSQPISEASNDACRAIALEVAEGVVNTPEAETYQLLKDTYRIRALSAIPALTWESRELNVKHVVTLTLFSSMWCMTALFMHIARRWNDLAKLIWANILNSRDGLLDSDPSTTYRSVNHHSTLNESDSRFPALRRC